MIHPERLDVRLLAIIRVSVLKFATTIRVKYRHTLHILLDRYDAFVQMRKLLPSE